MTDKKIKRRGRKHIPEMRYYSNFRAYLRRIHKRQTSKSKLEELTAEILTLQLTREQIAFDISLKNQKQSLGWVI
jgi:hypothetical protein